MEEYTKNKNLNQKRKNEIAASATPEALIKRVNIFIEEKDWESAKLYLEQVTDIEPDNPEIYLLKIFVENKVSTDKELIELCSSKGKKLTDNTNYKYIEKFGNEGIIQRTKDMNEKILKNIADRQEKKKETDYNKAIDMAHSRKIKDLQDAKKILIGLDEYKDAKEHIKNIDKRIYEEEEIKKKKSKKTIIVCIISILIITGIIILFTIISNQYKKQEYLSEVEKFKEALITEGYQQKDEQNYYIGNGWEYTINDENVYKISAGEIIYYWSDGPCNYYQINPYEGKIIQLSNQYRSENLIKWDQEKNEKDYNFSFYLEYQPLQKTFNGHYSIYRNKTMLNNIEIEYNIVNKDYSGISSFEEKSKTTYEEDLKKVTEKIEKEVIQNLIDKYDINLDKIYKYANSGNNYKDELKKVKENYYLQGEKELEDNNLEKAFDYYTKANNFNDSEKKKVEIADKIAKNKLEENNLKEAIIWYERANNTEEINEVKYNYIQMNLNREDEDTYKYLKSLTQLKYKDTEDIYNKLYNNVKATLIVNTDKEDIENNYSTIKQSKSLTIYVHCKVEGGYPGQEIEVRISRETMWGLDGEVNKNKLWDNENSFTISAYAGETVTNSFYQASNIYYHRLTAINTENNEVLAQSVIYTPYDK